MRRFVPGLLWPSLVLFVVAGCAEPEPGLARGEALFDTCVPCHGLDGDGSEELAAPAIAGMEQWYLTEQLTKFRAGDRGAHPDDLEGARMRPMARTLRGEADVSSVAEYIASLPPASPEPTLTGGDAEGGKAAWAVCVACHGPQGTGNEALGAPSLVGLSDWYLLSQLTKFQSGHRGTDPDDARGAQMRPMAMTLKGEQSLLDVIAHIQTLGN